MLRIMPIKRIWKEGSKLIVVRFTPKAAGREDVPAIFVKRSETLREYQVRLPNNKVVIVSAVDCKTAYGRDWTRAVRNYEKKHSINTTFKRKYIDEKGS